MKDIKELKVTGSKNGSGMAEFIINHIPDCISFTEGFGGRGIVSKILENSGASVGNIWCLEINPETFHSQNTDDYSIRFILTDAIEWINAMIDCGEIDCNDCFYFDPPYRMESRSHKRKYYGKFDWEDSEHQRFFALVERLQKIGAFVLISHYPDPVYDEQFKSWNQEDFQTRTRHATVKERLYWNFDLNDHWLATTDYLGKNFTDRQRINRKTERMANKIKALPRHEQQKLWNHL